MLRYVDQTQPLVQIKSKMQKICNYLWRVSTKVFPLYMELLIILLIIY
jgi:hypothetical protein